jgi:hypothetical protein
MPAKKVLTAQIDRLENLIYEIRGQKVMLDTDLAAVYGVTVGNLNKAVKRNRDRFPADFAFQLTRQEVADLRFQIGISSSRHGGRRYLPYVFTEYGAIMAANVLNSPRAAQMSVFVVRAFVRMRGALSGNRELSGKLAALEKEIKERLNVHEAAIVSTFRLRGDLEKTLAVKKERERFETDKTLEEKNLVDVPVQLRELQQQFLSAPGKAIEEIAKGYVVKLEEVKRKLTIDDKLDEAILAQQEIDKILKKYGVVNPTKGSEIQTQDLPKYIRMSRDVTIPTIVDGQQVGYTGLSKGEAYKLVKVDGTQVTILLDRSDIVIPVDATDLLKRIEQKQKGLKEEDEESDAAPQLTTGQQVARSIVGTWHDGGGWTLVFSRNGTVNLEHSSPGITHNGTWSVNGTSVYVRWDNGCWDAYGPPINPSATPSVNCNGGKNSWSKPERFSWSGNLG